MVVVAHYVLFIQLKPTLEERLYQNSATVSNASAVDLPQALDKQLEVVQDGLQDVESHRLAGRCLLQVTAGALERVFLDGGPLRRAAGWSTTAAGCASPACHDRSCRRSTRSSAPERALGSSIRAPAQCWLTLLFLSPQTPSLLPLQPRPMMMLSNAQIL